MLSHSSAAAPRRVNSLLRDLVFPFYSPRQAIWLGLLTAIVFLFFHIVEGGGWDFALVAWCSGSLVLTASAPARLDLPVSKIGALRDLLTRMRFIENPARDRWSYDFPRWLQWSNSDLLIRKKEWTLELTGPMATLRYISTQL